jgi:hypothetical protein
MHIALLVSKKLVLVSLVHTRHKLALNVQYQSMHTLNV